MANQEDQVAEAFTNHYYPTFCTNRPGLLTMYTEQSMLTFEGVRFVGQAAIMQKFSELSFQKCDHAIDTKDAQPSTGGGIVVFVTGKLRPEGETQPLKFSHIFHLVPVNGNFVISNEMFRLNMG